MRYLQIHKVLYMILCLLWFIFHFAIYLIGIILCFLWCFKIPKYSEYFSCCEAHYKGYNQDNFCFKNHFDAKAYVDKNPKETLLRYYHYVF